MMPETDLPAHRSSTPVSGGLPERSPDSDTRITRSARPAKPWVRDVGVVVAVFAAFATCAVLSWESFGSTVGPSFFYPSAGVTASALILNRRALWPAIVAAVVAAEILVDSVYGNPLPLSVVFAASNVVEPLIGATLVLAWCGGPPDLRKRAEFLRFVVGACIAGPFAGGLIGGSASSVVNGLPWLPATLTWWSGDALGVLVMASPILLWRNQSYVVRRRPWDMAAVLVVIAALSTATFWVHFAPAILILPVLAWAAFRVDMLGAAIAGALAAFLTNIMSTRGQGPFSHERDISPSGQVVLTQLYIAVIVIVAMLIAQEAAARLRAVREREAERRERMRLETLSRLALQLSAALTPHDIGRALENQVLSEAGAQALTLALISDDGRDLECIAMAGYPEVFKDHYGTSIPLTQRSVGTDVVRSGAPIEIQSFAEYAAAYPTMAPYIRTSGDWAVVGWPLSSGGAPFGALVLTWADSGRLDQTQRAFVSATATMVSQALVRAKVYVDERARAMLLHSVAQPVAPVDAVGLTYRALYRPADTAHGLGGDWYSVMALPGGRSFLSIGDVIGHGLMSVEDMAQLRSSGNAFAHQGLSPAHILAELNRFSVHQIRGEFASNLVAIFDPDAGTLTYSSAGHPPALLRRAGTGEVIRLSGAQGPVLGPMSDAEYRDSVLVVGRDDVLVMYTDGLVEHDALNLDVGVAHLEQIVASWPPNALLDCESLVGAAAPSPQVDDICLLVARFGAPDAE